MRAVIVGGAKINNYDFVKSYLKDDDFYIFCDKGLNHIEKLGVKPSLIIGDFDSHSNPNLDVETIVLPCIKDDTDTVFAIKEVVKRDFDTCILVGVIGERMDHSLANLYTLSMLYEKGIKGMIIDDYSTMEIVDDKYKTIDSTCKYFSLVNIDVLAEGIDIVGAKYELNDAKIDCSYQYAVSNEVVKDIETKVRVKTGKLLLITVFNE